MLQQMWWVVVSEYLSSLDAPSDQRNAAFNHQLAEFKQHLEKSVPYTKIAEWIRKINYELAFHLLVPTTRQEAQWWSMVGEILRREGDWEGANLAFGRCLRLIPIAETIARLAILDRFGQTANLIHHDEVARESYQIIRELLTDTSLRSRLQFVEGDVKSFEAHALIELAQTENNFARFDDALTLIERARQMLEAWAQIQIVDEKVKAKYTLHRSFHITQHDDPITKQWNYLSLSMRKQFAYALLGQVRTSLVSPDLTDLDQAYTAAAVAAKDSEQWFPAPSLTDSSPEHHLSRSKANRLPPHMLPKRHHASVHPARLYSLAAEIALTASALVVENEKQSWLHKAELSLKNAWRHTAAEEEEFPAQLEVEHMSELRLLSLELNYYQQRRKNQWNEMEETTKQIKSLAEKSQTYGVPHVAGAAYLVLGEITKPFNITQAKTYFTTALQIFDAERHEEQHQRRGLEVRRALGLAP